MSMDVVRMLWLSGNTLEIGTTVTCKKLDIASTEYDMMKDCLRWFALVGWDYLVYPTGEE